MALRPLRSALEGWRPTAGVPADPLTSIAIAWPSIVGARVAENSAPLELRGETLHVVTRSSAWSQQLQFLSATVLERVATLGLGPRVDGVRFKVGSLRAAAHGPVGVAAESRKRRSRGVAPREARDEREALESVRRRIADTRRVAAGSCKRCAAPLESGTLCAPCDGERTAVRRRALESVLFNAPWLESAEIVALVEGVTRSDIEIARKALLIRWWVVLDRARRSTRPLGVRERQVASSYVLLQSGLPPDRITPEIVRNLLGDDLEARLARVE